METVLIGQKRRIPGLSSRCNPCHRQIRQLLRCRLIQLALSQHSMFSELQGTTSVIGDAFSQCVTYIDTVHFVNAILNTLQQENKGTINRRNLSFSHCLNMSVTAEARRQRNSKGNKSEDVSCFYAASSAIECLTFSFQFAILSRHGIISSRREPQGESLLMLSESHSERGTFLDQNCGSGSDPPVNDQAQAKRQRTFELHEICAATHIMDSEVLTELINCGVRANSLHLLTLIPLVHVAWSNGYLKRAERLAILQAAEEEGIKSDSPGFPVVDGWLRCRPEESLFETWRDYLTAIRRLLSAESFNKLHLTTVTRAWQVAEAAGGLFGFLKVSRAEELAIQDLNLAFVG